MSPTRVTVVIPTYNELENLPRIVGALLDLDEPWLEVLVVDDGSPDGTGQLADRLAAGHARVSVLHREVKDGLGRAYVAGMTRALADGADVVVQMDADGSHPVAALPRMLAALRDSGAAVAVGSRYVPGGSVDDGWPWHRKALSAGANRYVRRILRLDVRDATAGFKAWRAEALTAVDPEGVGSRGYCFQFELAHRVVRAGLSAVEVPIDFVDRTAGQSKMSLRVQLEAAVVPWQLRSAAWQPAHQVQPEAARA